MRKIIFILIIIIFLIVKTVNGQNIVTIQGRLIDKSNNPLQSTIIVGSLSNKTDSNGNYFLQVPQGTYDINYSLQDFWIELSSVNINSNMKDIISLVTRYNNKISFTLDLDVEQLLQLYIQNKPTKISINNTGITEASSLSNLNGNTWFYDPNGGKLYVKAIPYSSLVGYWKFDEGTGSIAKDSSLFHNNGTLYSSPTWIDGKFGSALQFSGSNYVEAPDSSYLDLTNQITITAWINPSSIGAYNRIVAKSYTSNSNPWTEYGLLFDDANHIRLEIATGGTQNAVNGLTTIPSNQWTFVAGTYDGSTMKVYVNGVLDNSFSHSGAIDTDSMPLSIGRSGFNYDYFTGGIDEIKVWNRALTADEIKSEYGVSYTPDLRVYQSGTMNYLVNKTGQILSSSSDPTAVLNTMVANAVSGDNLLIDAGTYVMTSSGGGFTIAGISGTASSPVTLTLAPGAILRAPANFDDAIIHLNGVQNWVIQGGEIDGNIANQAYALDSQIYQGRGIVVENSANCTLQNTYMHDVRIFGYSVIRGSSGIKILNNHITYVGANGITLGDDWTGQVTQNCLVQGNLVEHCSDVGISVYGSNNQIMNNTVQYMDTNNGFGAANGQPPSQWGIACEGISTSGNLIQGNTITNANAGFAQGGTDTSNRATNQKINSNTIRNCGVGIWFEGGNYNSGSGNSISATQYCIQLGYGVASYNTFTSNTLNCNGATGIFVASGCNNNNFAGNTYANCATNYSDHGTGNTNNQTVTTCSSLTYPADRWQRVWYTQSTGTCLGNGPDQTQTTFDDNWGAGTVAYNLADDIQFSSSRTINFATAGTYTFTLGSDDGARLWIDDVLEIDKWIDRGYTTDSVTLSMTTGNHKFRIDYYENGGNAEASFYYSQTVTPGGWKVFQNSTSNYLQNKAGQVIMSSSDATAVINAAIANAVSGDTILIDVGTYILTDALGTTSIQKSSTPTSTATNVVLTFASGAIIKAPNNFVKPMMYLVGVSNWTIQGGEFDGNGVNQPYTPNTSPALWAGHCIHLASCNSLTIQNMYVHDCKVAGLWAEAVWTSSSGIKFLNNVVSRVGANGMTIGMWGDKGSTGTMQGNTVSYCGDVGIDTEGDNIQVLSNTVSHCDNSAPYPGFVNSYWGIGIESGYGYLNVETDTTHNTVQNNAVSNCGSGIAQGNIQGLNQYSVISHNTISSCGSGITLFTGDYTTVTYNNIIGNGVAFDCVQIQSSSYNTVSYNTFSGATFSAVRFEGPSGSNNSGSGNSWDSLTHIGYTDGGLSDNNNIT